MVRGCSLVASRRPCETVALVVAILVVAIPREAPAEAAGFEVAPYVGVAGGLFLWPNYSNRDELEADTSPGYAWSGVLGLELRAGARGVASSQEPPFSLRRLGARFEVEGGQRIAPIHGINDGPLQLTGDGKLLRATSAQVNLWPHWRVSRRWHLYLGGGGGVTFIRALGSDKRVASGQVGLGAFYAFPVGSFTGRIDIGWRSFFADSTQLRGALSDFDAHGGNLAFQLGF